MPSRHLEVRFANQVTYSCQVATWTAKLTLTNKSCQVVTYQQELLSCHFQARSPLSHQGCHTASTTSAEMKITSPFLLVLLPFPPFLLLLPKSQAAVHSGREKLLRTSIPPSPFHPLHSTHSVFVFKTSGGRFVSSPLPPSTLKVQPTPSFF